MKFSKIRLVIPSREQCVVGEDDFDTGLPSLQCALGIRTSLEIIRASTVELPN